MAWRGLVALVGLVATLGACKDVVSLRDTPDAGDDARVVVTPCDPTAELTTLGVMPDGFEPVALAARAGAVAVVGRSAGDGGGLVFFRAGGRSPTYALGAVPSSVAFDGAYAFVGSRLTDVARFSLDGERLVAPSTRAAYVAAGLPGRAAWALGGELVAWHSGVSAPRRIAALPADVLGLASDEATIFYAQEGAVVGVDSSGREELRAPSGCQSGTPFVDRESFVCVGNGSVFVTSRATRSTAELASGQDRASTVVAARGRVVWRRARGGRGELVAAPRDGAGEPSPMLDVDTRTPLLAADACGAYVVTGSSLVFVPL